LKTKAAQAEGKGINLNESSDTLIDFHTSSRGNEVLGEAATVTLFDLEGNPYQVEKFTAEYDLVMRKAHKAT
jgi:hypothetical protein